MNTRLTRFLLALVIVGLLPVQQAHAQAEPSLTAEATLFLHWFPQVRQLPAPAWLREGVRVTYVVQTSATSSPEGTVAAGAGYVQYDLATLDHTAALATRQTFVENGKGGWTPLFDGARAGLPAVGEYWLAPAALVHAEAAANAALTVTRQRRLDAAGQMHAVVRFQAAPEGRLVWEFDAATGVLVYHATDVITSDGAHAITIATLAQQRQRPLSWPSRRAPAWVHPGVTLHYQGTRTTRMADVEDLVLPLALTVTITQVKPHWTLANFAMDGAVQLGVSGAGPLSGTLFLPLAAWRADLTPGTIDRDPVTDATVAWTQGEQDALVFTESGPGFVTRYTYASDTDALSAIEQTTQVGPATIITQLQRVE